MDMPPVRLTREEITSLRKLVERARPSAEIPADHAAKFINCGLAERDIMIMRGTRLGQLELLRQRFSGIGLMRGPADEGSSGGLLFSSRN
jgi:hypothetical protein